MRNSDDTPTALDRLLLERELSRRQMLVTTGKAMLGGTAAAILAACGITASPSASAGTSAAASGGARAGGVARLALSDGSPQDTIDPPNMGSTLFSNITAISLYDNIMVGDDQTLQPTQNGIVNDWDISDDLMTWTLRVRDGVVFHDGSPMTARDVAHSIQIQVEPDGPSPNSASAGQFLRPQNVRAVDDTTVELVLDQPNAFFYVYLQNRFMRVVKEGVTGPNEEHIGTGPFVFSEFTPGVSYHATRNPNYWQEGKPYLDEIEFLQVPDPASQYESLTAKQVDVIQALTLPLAQTLESSADHTVLVLPNQAWTFMVMDPRQNELFANRDVIQAVKLAVDRQELIDTVYAGFADAGYDTPIPSSDGFFNSELALPERDLDAVQAHLEAAGFPDGIDIGELVTGDITGSMVDFATALQQQLASANINCTIRQADAATYYDNIWLQEPLYVSYNLRRHPAEVFNIFYSGDAPYNESGFVSQEFDDALNAAFATTDFDEQKAAFDTAQRLVYEEDNRVLPLFAADVYGIDRKLVDVKPSPLNIISFTDAYWDS